MTKEPRWDMAVGDVASKEMGTGARANGGKPKWELMPLPQIQALMEDEQEILQMADYMNEVPMTGYLASFQIGLIDTYTLLKYSVAYNWAKQGGSDRVTLLSSLENVIRVWDFGLRKYAPFNWATGMNWSVCIACMMRHIKYHFECDDVDNESGELHSAHVVCNAMMLQHYNTYWTQGDDRPLFAFPQVISEEEQASEGG